MLRKVQENFSEKLETPDPQWSPRQSSAASKQRDVAIFKFEPDTWSWSQRPRIEYKGEKRIPFKDISRVELFGKYGEQADFELRYFEIQPGGFSSCEKHFHVHCVIGARGEGQLKINDQYSPLKPFDVAHIPPLSVHQLQNKSQHPFGFFCIVDRKRDRPVKG
jgi:ribulose-bisphosphate carboxylase large chain